MTKVGVIGTGFVADLYMPSLLLYPDLVPVAAHDIRPDRLSAWCDRWGIAGAASLDELIDRVGQGGLILNLTNPAAHFEVSARCIAAGLHVYSEKPLATDLADAEKLHAMALERGVLLASAPCSFLGEAAQVVGAALRAETLGRARLVYAELDDDFIAQAPYRKWISETGAPWPAEDEFEVGCTLEHAGYYLTWLMSWFGPVRTVSAASARIAPDLLPVDRPAPDMSVATLFFESGMVARLTCSILAPLDRSLRIVGDRGVLELDDCWNNSAPVRFRRRFTVRRRLVTTPFARRLRLAGSTHAKVTRRGAATMNFALGPREVADALAEGRPCRMSADLALHLTEVTLAIQNAGETGGAVAMRSRCDTVAPMPWAERLKGD